MGRPKLLLSVGGTTVIEAALAAWRSGGVTRTVVVVRGEDVTLADCCRAAGAEVVIPPVDPPEMKDSVAAGLEYVRARHDPRDADCWLMAPADLPRLSAQVIQQLLREYERLPAPILVPVHEGRRGHPVLFNWSLAAGVAGLGGQQGVDTLLARHVVRESAAGPECLAKDLDTPGDLEHWQ
jgi:molybdenum cofactor cytidylyltransferase